MWCLLPRITPPSLVGHGAKKLTLALSGKKRPRIKRGPFYITLVPMISGQQHHLIP